nr:hypothetical protein [Mesorhizobium sp.]
MADTGRHGSFYRIGMMAEHSGGLAVARNEDKLIDARERVSEGEDILIVPDAHGGSARQPPACGLDVADHRGHVMAA